MPTNPRIRSIDAVTVNYVTRPTNSGKGLEIFINDEWIEILPGQVLQLTFGVNIHRARWEDE